jgi:hypothetical protein
VQVNYAVFAAFIEARPAMRPSATPRMLKSPSRAQPRLAARNDDGSGEQPVTRERCAGTLAKRDDNASSAADVDRQRGADEIGPAAQPGPAESARRRGLTCVVEWLVAELNVLR